MIQLEMTSLEIAELTGKAHKHINETIRKKLLPTLETSRDFDPSIFSVASSTYVDKSNRSQNMYILNRFAVNSLLAYYDVKFACMLTNHVHNLEVELEKKQKELEVMQGIVWEVINGQAFLSQELALKSSGCDHPRLFMKFLKRNPKFYSSVLDRSYLQTRQCNQHGDRWWKFSKAGFKWLVANKDTLNTWVKEQKELDKLNKVLPA